MPQQEGYGAIDPFGAFLMAAYMGGMVPGSQTSAYNTVLDLLSPGAVAGRQEAGQPNIVEQFENMFGGVNLTNKQISDMQAQATGLQLTPQEKSAERTALTQSLATVLASRGAGVEAAEKTAEATAALVPLQADEIRARTGMYERQGKVDLTSPQAQKALMDLNIQSLIMNGALWDPATGKPSTEPAKPEQIEAAKAMAGMQQTNPMADYFLRAMLAMINSGDGGTQQLGRGMFEDVFGYRYEDAWIGPGKVLRPAQPGLPGVTSPAVSGATTPGSAAVNEDAVRAEIERWERWYPMSLNPESTRETLRRLYDSLGEELPPEFEQGYTMPQRQAPTGQLK